MSYPISLNDVAQAANVSISTVSLVVNGKADRRRIAPVTQERVRAVARQLGYQPNQIARDIVLGKGRPQPLGGISAAKSQTPEMKTERQQMGLILSTASSADTGRRRNTGLAAGARHRGSADTRANTGAGHRARAGGKTGTIG